MHKTSGDMKKYLLTICLALAGLSSFAQEKGDMSVGVNLGVAPCIESGASLTNFGIGAKFRYHVTSPIRVEADLDYWLKSKECDVLDFSVNAHYLFKVTDKINVYPVVGLGYARVGSFISYDDNFDDYDFPDYGRSSNNPWEDMEDYMDESSSALNRMLINVGIGADYALTDRISVGAEIKYQYIKDFNRLPINIGVTYKF